MAGTIRVFDPTGHVQVRNVPLAPRPAALAGLRPGVLENSKHNAELLMTAMLDGLRERIPLGATVVGHKGIPTPPSKATFEKLRDASDFVLVGTSD